MNIVPIFSDVDKIRTPTTYIIKLKLLFTIGNINWKLSIVLQFLITRYNEYIDNNMSMQFTGSQTNISGI